MATPISSFWSSITSIRPQKRGASPQWRSPASSKKRRNASFCAPTVIASDIGKNGRRRKLTPPSPNWTGHLATNEGMVQVRLLSGAPFRTQRWAAQGVLSLRSQVRSLVCPPLHGPVAQLDKRATFRGSRLPVRIGPGSPSPMRHWRKQVDAPASNPGSSRVRVRVPRGVPVGC